MCKHSGCLAGRLTVFEGSTGEADDYGSALEQNYSLGLIAILRRSGTVPALLSCIVQLKEQIKASLGESCSYHMHILQPRA